MNAHVHTEVACRSELNLWKAVLLNGVRDAVGVPVSEGTSRKVVISRAKAWMGSDDFYEVCELAGMDGDFILDNYRSGRLCTESMNAALGTRRGRPKKALAQ